MIKISKHESYRIIKLLFFRRVSHRIPVSEGEGYREYKCMYVFCGCAFMTAKQNKISCPDKYLIIDLKSTIIKAKDNLLRLSLAGGKTIRRSETIGKGKLN